MRRPPLFWLWPPKPAWVGLNMDFKTDGEKVLIVVTIAEPLRGFHILVHYGVTSTILDEVMR